ncbi:hypothetical protein QUF61_01980 [Candidatus Venteria ishoeyi]|uniref:hypothetical protein n=1 Tax=Candidatus Venteria ishoeyi TaxID=1899563 RepID=UPI0025A53EDC|nr:hypothetical protein [Candidatus Venteria ishoeyi]MDM8545241.1 hypothetical protein [Candidatus Venteria ishoeyi]
MEFFAIANIEVTPATLQALTVDKLNKYCADINKVLHIENDNQADVYCVWGEFTVHRQVINGGVRFSLPDCPNALAWTITTGFAPEPEKVVIHCTINRTEHDADFIDSIQLFIQSWQFGLEKNLGKRISES